jgi:hypothetical protein
VASTGTPPVYSPPPTGVTRGFDACRPGDSGQVASAASGGAMAPTRSAHIHCPENIVPDEADLFALSDIVIADPSPLVIIPVLEKQVQGEYFFTSTSARTNTSRRRSARQLIGAQTNVSELVKQPSKTCWATDRSNISRWRSRDRPHIAD